MAGPRPQSMYQQQDSWRAPGGEPAPDYFPPDSAELPTPFAQDAGPSSSRTTTSNDQAQPDPWAEYLSAPTNKWGHSSWEWRGDGWDSWNWRSENTRAYNQPRGGNAWTRHASWDGTWGSASTGSGGDGGMDQNEAKQDDGSAPAGGKGTTAAGRTSLTSPATTTTSAPTPATMPTSRGEGGEEAIRGAGPSERMVVPSFSGGSGDDGEELGTTARSYLRQVAAWQKMTRLSPCRQGLVLYQNLSGKAWIEAERLDLELLGSSNGVSHLVEWIKERYLDVQVTQVGRALSDFFRKLRKKPGQSIRDYVGEFDRAQARLEECGCSLPNIAQAWVFIDRMNLDEPSELNLLASVGNLYDLRKLQQAAIIQDRALRKPWESSSGAKPWARRQNQSAHMADALDTEEIHQDEPDLHDGANDPIPEHLAEELFTTFMSHETAKQKYRDNQKNRGTDPQALKDIAAERLKQMKARSFCAGCKRRGHWHRDEACPLNQAKKNREDNGAGDDNRAPLKSTYMTCNVVHVAWNMDKKDLSAGFDAITDTACSKSVAGNDWMEEYTTRLEDIGVKPQLLTNDEYFRFGASRVFHSTMACVLTFRLGKAVIEVKIAIVQGELPLLLSRPVLARLGMVMDVATNRADFRKVDAYDVPLKVTESGHPALPLSTLKGVPAKATAAFWAAEEIKIHTTGAAYTVFAAGVLAGFSETTGSYTSAVYQGDSSEPPRLPSSTTRPWVPTGSSTTSSSSSSRPRLFYPKKIDKTTRNMLTGDSLNEASFMSWWQSTNISNDFWIETPNRLYRIHVIPRRTSFSPQKWTTHQHERKQALLEQLGRVRESWGFSCKTHKSLTPVHDLWRDEIEEDCYPVVWVGRTSFARRPMPLSKNFLAIRDGHSSDRPREAAGDLRDEEAGALGGAQAARSTSSPEVDGTGTPQRAGRGEGQEARDDPAEGAEQHDPGRAPDHGGGASHRLPEDREQGGAHEDDQGHDAGCFRAPDDLRQIQGLPVPGGPSWISAMGAGGSSAEHQRLERLGDVCCLGGEGAALPDSSRVPRPGGGGDDPVQPGGRERLGPGDGPGEGIIFHLDNVYPDQCCGPAAEGRVCSSGATCPTESDDAKGQERAEGGDATAGLQQASRSPGAGPDCHGPRAEADRRPGGGGDRGPRDEAGPTSGSASDPAPTRQVSDMVYDGYDCGGDAYDVYYEDFLSVDQVELWSAQGIPDTNKDLPVEIAATRALYDKDFTYDTMLKVSDLLPDSAVIQLRMGATGRPNGKSNKSLVGGAWAHGNKAGATNNLGQYPQLFKYINAWGHHHGIKGWSSVMLTKNVAHLVHADNHNLPGYPNHTTSYGQFVGGELWVALENYEESLDYKVVWKQDRNGKDHPGELINTREQIVEFNPKKLHATQAWSGTRWCLTFFASRGVTMLARRERDLLQQLGFGLPDRRRTPPLLQEDNKTRTTSRPPKRSARKLIQKTAKRLSALATWTILAAMNYTAAHVPLPGRTEPVALCEVGGTNKTEELSTMDEFFATEPINVDFLVGIGGRKRAVEVIRELRPATLWIHGGNIADTGDTIVELVEEQKKAFGRIVIEAPSDHAFWVTPLAAIFYDDPTATVFEEENNKTIEINGTSAAWKQAVDTGGNPSLQVYMASNEERQQGADQRDDVHLGAAGISFPGEPRVKPEVSSALKRLHANLGHPSQADLTRHLRLAGAGPEVIQASKRLQCETCQRASKGGIARPATLPTLLSFNQVVGVDIFSVTDAFDERIEMMSIYDHGTSYHIAGPLQGHSTEAMEQTFCELWSRTFGAPGTIALDLESGLQAGLARYSSWHGCHLRPIAGQAHWQLGATERHGGVWKAIWRRLCDDLSVGEDDISLAVAAVNQAKNELRRTSGYSPSQAVFGRDPYVPGELLDEKDGEQQEQLINQDLQRGREHAIRMAARAAYFRVQGDQKLRRALLQRSRVTGEELHPGDLVFFLRKPKNSKDWSWKGPGTVVGTEHKNLWISFGGRCHLVAPEHVRRATNEETGNAFILKTNRDDLQRLVEYDPDDVDMFEDEDNAGPVQHEGGPLPPVPEDDWDISSLMSYAEDIELPEGNDERTFGTYERPDPPDLLPAGPVPKRMRKKGPQQVNMMRQATTQRGKEKQLERELPWHCIPESQHAAFKEAELKQWNEHLQHGAMEPVDVETSAEILRSRPERVLPSRFAYRDKHWAKRKQDNSLPWKCKARLVIGGHRDPDLDKGLATSAPTVSRQGVLLLCQILASRRKLGWGASAGDITCAFLNGNRLERELYIRQPRAGLGDLDPRQLVRLTKGVFGLVDSPNAWWGKLYQSILNMKVELEDGREGFFDQCPLDPCIFQFKVVGTDGQPGVPECYVAVHVDDLLMVGDKGLNSQLKAAFSKTFPVEDWEDDAFEYTGSFFEVNDKGVFIRQENYVDTRLFEVFVNPAEHDETIATAEQKADNRSLIGALSWIAGQTRPDLQTGVSMAQQLQREPTAGDVRFTNLLSKRAKQYKECGVHLTPVNLDTCVLLAYHDAAWANAPQDPDDPYYELTPEENEIGTLKDGPFAYKDRKAKRGNSRVASQLGGVYLLADEGILHGGESPVSLIDWRSWACDRVCRSTFAAESMSCAGGIENAQYLQSFLATLLQGCLVRPKQSALKVRYLSDCRSLFDHLRREGLPRVPSDRRLAIDLAAIRCDLKLGGKLVWLPTELQVADIMTKPLKPEAFWRSLKGPLKLPFVEKEENF